MSSTSDASSTDSTYTFYYYNPSMAGAVIYTICFAVLLILQSYQIIMSIIRVSRSKTSRVTRGSNNGGYELQSNGNESQTTNKNLLKGGHRFSRMLIPFYLALICEVIGHIARALNHDDLENRNKYIIQSILMLISPPLFSATLYMVFGRLITFVLHNEKCLIVPSKWLTKICVAGDIISLLMQGGGAGILVQGGDSYKTGQNVVLGGLGVQIIFFGFFIIVETIYFIRLNKNKFSTSYNSLIVNGKLADYPSRFQNWKLILLTLFLSSIFILVRSIFRIAEYTEEHGGTIAQHEWYLYIFDSLMMLLTGILFVSQDTSNYIIKAIPITNDESGYVVDGDATNDYEEGLKY